MHKLGTSLPHFSHLLQGPQWWWQLWKRIAKLWQWLPLWSPGQRLPQPLYGHTKCSSDEETLDTVDLGGPSKHIETSSYTNSLGTKELWPAYT